jgi:tetratricopeptide (TPR) repeat protein
MQAVEDWHMNRGKVFITYRRETGAETARLVKESLQKRGYRDEDVFLDVENLRSGPFNTELLNRIEAATDVIVVLTPGSLDRCKNPDDWVRQEVAHAMRCKKNIVPVMARGFVFPTTGLPEDIRSLSTYNGIAPSYELFQASMDKLVSLLVGRPKPDRLRIYLLVPAAVLLGIIGVAAWWVHQAQSPPRGEGSRTGQVHIRPAKSATTPDTKEGDRLFDAKDYANAFHEYCQASDADLNDVSLHRKIEECAQRGHLEKQFLDRYRAIVQDRPNSPVLRNYLGNAYLMLDPQDRDGKAREQYQIALTLDKGFSPPLMNLGIIAFRQGQLDEAQAQFDRYLAVNPQDAVGWADLGVLYATRVEKDPNDAQAVDKGLPAVDRAIQLDPGLATAHKSMGRILAATGRKAEALKAFQRSLALDYEQPDVRRQFELLAWDLGADRLIAGGPDDLQTRSMQRTKALSIMQALDQGQFDQAEKASRELTGVDPENALVWRLLAKALDGLQRSDEAAEVGEKATRLATEPEVSQ